MCRRVVALTCNVDADRLAEGSDNDGVEVDNPKEVADPLSGTSGSDDDAPELGRLREVEVDNPKEIVDPLSETSGSDADALEDSDNDDPTDVDTPKEVVDPLSETLGRDDDAPELGRLREVDGRLTDKVDEDMDWPTRLGADVEGTVIIGEAEDGDTSMDGKLAEMLSELDD
jgi:hypothetical protein